MKINITHRILVAGLVILFSCKPTIEEFSPSKGSADFSAYLALGDSWSAGYADASLYKSGQEMSFPAILAKQFAKTGGGEFRQPLMLDDIGVGLSTGVPTPKLELAFRQDCLGATVVTPGYVDEPVNPANLAPLGDPNPFNNISIPALKSIHLGVEGYGLLNPYYGRFASSAQAKVLDEVPRINPTFFTLALGMYDVLSYALNGGVGDPPTDETYFAGSLMAALQVLTANGAAGAVSNIPNILDAPYFNTIPYNALPLSEQSQVDALNAAYFGLNQLIKAAGSDDTLSFSLGPNPVVIQDPALPWGIRQIHSDEFLLMSVPQDSLKCKGWGSQLPIADHYVLDSEEITVVEEAVSVYNNHINQIVSGMNVALVDLQQELTFDLVFDGVTLGNRLVSGNFYSLDGVNPTPMGNAAIAYFFIDAINKKFNANIPQVIVPEYPAVTIP